MKNTTSVSVALGDKTMTFETGLLARQAAGQATCQLGETMVFSAVTNTNKPREGIDFFPLQIEYRERFYAAGRFPGGYFKREGRPTEKEILTARMTDRPIRPLFAEGFFCEVQINNALMTVDGENESDILSINAASAALMLSELPFLGPVGAVRVGRINGQYVLNPSHIQMKDSDIDLIYVARRDLPIMIEGSALEVSNADMVAAMKFGHEAVVKICDAQTELRAKMGLAPKTFTETKPNEEHVAKLREIAGADLEEALFTVMKLERGAKMGKVFDAALAKMQEIYGVETITEKGFKQLFDVVEIEIVRKGVLEKGKRMDGRAMDQLRPLLADVGILPRVHGSALFSRGETQAMAVTTLGTGRDEQDLDGLTGGDTSKRFTLHYNFPPYCTGEVRRLGGLNRREIGHGALAERSIEPMIPGLPLLRARRLRGHGLQRLLLDGLRLRGHPRPDGCRRAHQEPRRGHLHRPRHRRRPPARPADRHPRRRRSLRRHGLQGRRHPQRHHRLPGRPEDPRPPNGTSSPAPSTRPKRPARRFSTRCWRPCPPRVRTSRPTPRASPS
jgi:polyribonucleotide nucleotidyltransferase